MYFATYKDTGNTFKDALRDSLPEAIEVLVKAIEAGMEKREDITAGIYDLDQPENKRLIVNYFASQMGDGETVLEKTKNITRDELMSAGVGYIDDDGFVILHRWDYEA